MMRAACRRQCPQQRRSLGSKISCARLDACSTLSDPDSFNAVDASSEDSDLKLTCTFGQRSLSASCASTPRIRLASSTEVFASTHTIGKFGSGAREEAGRSAVQSRPAIGSQIAHAGNSRCRSLISASGCAASASVGDSLWSRFRPAKASQAIGRTSAVPTASGTVMPRSFASA